MTMSKYARKLSMADARRWANDLDCATEDEFARQLECWKRHEIDLPDESYRGLRNTCVTAFDLTMVAGEKPNYLTDMEVGLALYEYLDTQQFTLSEASDDDVWRYMSVKVLPDLTYFRYPTPEKEGKEKGKRINRKRFFSHTRRIWAKTLWWYVHLSWQGNAEATRVAIRDNGSNIISHFIETPGRGYRVDAYRQIMLRYSQLDNKKDETFRAIAKLNGAECRTIEPALMSGGVEAYCDLLFEKAGVGKVDC